MPQISKRGQQMPESSIRKLVPLAEAAIKRGITVHKLNIGQPDIKTAPRAIEAIKNINLEIVEYAHSAGNRSLRDKFAEYYKRNDIHVTADDILVTTGASEALLTGLMSCMDAFDELIVPEPFYANYWGFSFTLFVKVVPVTCNIADGFALPSMEEFEKLITPHTKAILICNPNNPTGYLYSKAEMEMLAAIVKKHDLYLFCDEVYREFVYDGQSHFSVMNLKGIEDQVVMVDSISKRYSACGLRIGTLVTRNHNITATVLKYLQSRLSSPSIGQIAGEAAIDSPREYIEQSQREYQSRRDFLVKRINAIPGVICPNPKGAFYVMAKLPVDDSDKFCQWMLESFEYEKQTVMMAPGSGFYSHGRLGRHEVRIAYVNNNQVMDKALTCLEKALQVYPGRL